MGEHVEEEKRQHLSVTATPCRSCCFLNFFQDEKRQSFTFAVFSLTLAS